MWAMCGASALKPSFSLNTRRNTCRMTSRRPLLSALASMLKEHPSALPRTARWMSASSIESFDLVLEEEAAAARFFSPVAGLVASEVLEQVGQDLDEVRLARTEEAGHPDTHARSEVGRFVGRCQVGVEEAAEILGELRLVTTYSSSSCQTLSASFWSALITPFIGRLMGLVKGRRSSFLVVRDQSKRSKRKAQGTRRKAR